MKLFDVMYQACAQMGKLYFGNYAIQSLSPFSVRDTTIRINEGDYKGGTFFALGFNKTFTIENIDVNGIITFRESYVATTPTDLSYAITSMDRSTLLNAVNAALVVMGEHTTFTDIDVTATDQREFVLDSGIVPVKLEFFNYHNETFGFTFTNSWSWDLSIKDNKSVITFQNRILPDETAKVRFWYNAPHGLVINDTDEINPDYHTRRLVYESAYQGYFQFLAREQNSSDRDLMMFQTITQERQAMANMHPVPRLLHKITLPRN